MLIKQVVQEADGLDGLTQTHLISKDATVASVNYDRIKRGTGKLRLLENLISDRNYFGNPLKTERTGWWSVTAL